jgi:hypothetical protein
METAGLSVTSLQTTRRHPPEISNRLVDSFRNPVDQIQQHGCYHVNDTALLHFQYQRLARLVTLQTKEMDEQPQPPI